MKIHLIAGIASLVTLISLSLSGQTKINDNLIVPPNNKKFEVEIHGAGWSVTPVTRIFDSKLDEIYSDEIIYSLKHALRNVPITIDPSEIDYTRDFDYTSSGYYFGIAARYYPSGGSSKFVIGLGVDYTSVKVSGKTEFKQNIIRGLKADGIGNVELSPILANIHVQYYFSPTKKFSPYLTFGLGAGILNKNKPSRNNFNFDLNVSYIGIPLDSNFEYTLAEIEERSNKTIPSVMPLTQFSFGLKASLTDWFNINTEIGIYNGLHVKLGSAFRF